MDGLAMFHGPNAGYVLDLYEQYRRDPASLDAQTRALFDSLPPFADDEVAIPPPSVAPAAPTAVVNAVRLAHNIRVRGHLAARIDPLGTPPRGDAGLLPEGLGMRPSELLSVPADVVGGPCARNKANALEAIEALRRVYSGTMGFDFAHVQVPEERSWLYDAFESGRYTVELPPERKRSLLDLLTKVESLERFLHQAFVGQKRFSIEGIDMLVPILVEIVQAAAKDGAYEAVMGMAHRGRLNVLAHVLGKPYVQLFAEFREAAVGAGPAATEGINRGWTGDVKYHLGATGAMREGDAVNMMITLASNPSHLEFIDPVIEGMARAAQERRDRPGRVNQDTGRALPILIHGDSAFPGEGVVAETLNLSGLAGYTTGGTIHIIANNQLGFTTQPTQARSTLYASDLAKGFEIPIIHVNADDAAACMAAAHLAYAYRQRFRKDVLIDLVGYRRWGHNEGDEPAFTQPEMYERISGHPTARALWASQLEGEGIIPPGAGDKMLESAIAALREINRPLASSRPDEAGESGLHEDTATTEVPTAVPAESLRAYNEALLRWPEGFSPNPKLERQLERRRIALEPGGTIDWAHAETLAFAAILADGTAIRLTGQDTERGTFSQRHLVLHDPRTRQAYTALDNLPQAWASFSVYNSPLSEVAALGFEYGYSVHAPETLVLWEAQYGDFANAGQVIIDQFIVAARAKWRQRPALVMLLPHGYEGQGPEHSSARLERYLQLAAHDNLRIANPTTAAQYFHLLRRQAALLELAPRPLVIMTPKSLLRDARAASRLKDLAAGRFLPVLDDPGTAERRDKITRLVLCSGKVYLDASAAEVRAEHPMVAVARVEQLYPFPTTQLGDLLASYPNLREVVWMQEEPQNMGAWSFVAPRLRQLLGRDMPLSYAGRPERAAPAVGSGRVHAAEQAKVVADAFAGVRTLQREIREVKHVG